MERTEKLDAVDLAILRLLQQNARLTVKEVASEVHLSTTPVYERMRRLEARGYIRRYVAVLDAEKLGQGFVVFCSVKLKRICKEIAERFAGIVRDLPEVRECYNISGGYDYLLKIQVATMKEYQRFVLDVLGNIPELGSLESTFVMDELKLEYGGYLPAATS
jgi:Lrp/AsnC family leucine-responsive transcriptional regulator